MTEIPTRKLGMSPRQPPHCAKRLVSAALWAMILIALNGFLAQVGIKITDRVDLTPLTVRVDPLVAAHTWHTYVVCISYFLISLALNHKQLGHYYDIDRGDTMGAIAWTVGSASEAELNLDRVLNIIGTLMVAVAALLPTYWFLVAWFYMAIGLGRCRLTLARPALGSRMDRLGPKYSWEPWTPEFRKDMVRLWREKFHDVPADGGLEWLAQASLDDVHRGGGHGDGRTVRELMTHWSKSFFVYGSFACGAAVLLTLSTWIGRPGLYLVALHLILLAIFILLVVKRARLPVERARGRESGAAPGRVTEAPDGRL